MIADRMMALVYEGPRQMNMRQVQIPRPTEEEVLIRVEKAGICGSELSGYLGHNSLRVPPLVMGHEFAGTVKTLGKNVKGLKLGDRVTANPLVSCGRCDDCLAGRGHLCCERKLLGAHRQGAFAEYVTVPEQNVWILPDHVSMEAGALAEPFACAIHVCRLAKLKAMDRLYVAGAGPIGLLILQAASVLGVKDIVVHDINPDRLEIVNELGGISVSSAEELERAAPGRGFDVAVDAVGMDVTRQNCMQNCKTGGKVIFTGLHASDSMIPVNLAIRSELTMQGAFAYSPLDFKLALEWIIQGKVNLAPWTEQASLEQGGKCFERLLSNPGKVAKIMLTP